MMEYSALMGTHFESIAEIEAKKEEEKKKEEEDKMKSDPVFNTI